MIKQIDNDLNLMILFSLFNFLFFILVKDYQLILYNQYLVLLLKIQIFFCLFLNILYLISNHYNLFTLHIIFGLFFNGLMHIEIDILNYLVNLLYFF